MSDDKVMFRGVEVSKDWPEKIRQAQLQPTVRLIVKMPRIRYGREGKRWCSSDLPCHDCAVIAGEFHVPGCDMEKCPSCGGQLWMGCECEWPERRR